MGEEKIAMTAPVVMTDGDESTGECGKMKFILPAKFKDMTDIPVPTDSDVTLVELDPAIGVVYRYSGYDWQWRRERNFEGMLEQLEEDGVVIDEDQEKKCERWGYDPPLTPFFLRRNEIWCPLTDVQAKILLPN